MTPHELRARAWWHGMHAAVCDVIEPWQHGTIVRATSYPSYYGFNLVRVEEEPGFGAEELIAVADRALDGYAHRRIDIEPIEYADRVRPEFEERGWKTTRIVWMRFDGVVPDAPGDVEQVPYEAADGLRAVWHYEDNPDQPLGDFPRQQREVSLLRGAQVLAMFAGGEPVAYVQIERADGSAEVTHVYVHPEHRGGGRGTAITTAAIAAVGREVDDLWIMADDEDRPKELYARLGFRPVWRTMELTRWPGAGSA